MSWIKDNPFVVTLGGVTVVAAGALVFLGSHFSGKYQENLDKYTEDSGKVTQAEKLSIYPNKTNRDGKAKALADYRSELIKLQNQFVSFRPTELKKLSAQEFTENAKKADAKVREIFTASKTVVPDAFFLGFESYKGGALAKEGATAMLDYQLGAASELFTALAKAAPTEVKNVYRKELVEETGGTFDAKDAVYRAMPMEVTFVGTEKSLRDFLSAIEGSDTYYYVVRSIRVNNTREKAPSASDAKFEAPSKPAAGGAGGDPFGGGFQIPGEGAAPAPGAGGAAAAPAAPAAKPADTGKILQQVLGNEEVAVFIRLDILQFLPVKELPKP